MLQRQPYRVLGLGAVCIDQLAHVSEEFISHIKGKKGGCERLSTEELDAIKGQLNSPPILTTGGSSANVIKGLAYLGEKCAFISHIGNDVFGKHIAKYFADVGVIGLFTPSTYPTTQVLCLVTPDGQRTMRLHVESTEEINDHFLLPNFFKGAEHVHFTVYSLHNGNPIEKAMRIGCEALATVSLDLSSFEMVHKFQGKILDLLSNYVDIVFANRDEVFALLGLPPDEGCLKLQDICSVSVVMLGNQGCLVGSQGAIFHSPAHPTQVIDTTGAGDFFASGFIYSYLRKYPLEECARLANRFASEIVAVEGAELPPEKWAKMRELFAIP